MSNVEKKKDVEQADHMVNARLIYLVGIILWLIIWVVIIYGVMNQYLKIKMFIDSTNCWFLVMFSVVGCIIGLGINLKIWWTKRSFEDYKTESEIIVCVERNVGPLITANSLVLSITSLAYAEVLATFPPTSFIIYEILSLTFACFVLPLFWIPSDATKNLVRLRHIKTIFFFYGVFFFLAALITLGLCINT